MNGKGIMKSTFYTVFAIAAVIGTGARSDAAIIFQSSTGLSSPGTTINFNEFGGGLAGTLMSNQYDAFGIKNFAGLVYQPITTYMSPNIDNPQHAGNFFDAAKGVVNPANFGAFSITFKTPITRAAFAMAAVDANPLMFDAYLGAAKVEGFTLNQPDANQGQTSTKTLDVNNFFGFTNILFYKIQVTSLGTKTSNFQIDIDKLQFDSAAPPIPEPTSCLVFGMALLCSAGYARRCNRLRATNPSQA